ncbi:MAG: hypothetical protein OXC05_10120 [Halieaceae bacterium]|nr:hypothetical protein [Halieaceae bacterium]
MKLLGVFVLALLFLGQAGAVAAPACHYVTPTCESLNGQMQLIYSPRVDNNYGRIEDFYRIDHNRWLKAEAPRFRPLQSAKPVRGGKDREAEYLRGQVYASLSEQEKWQVLRAKDPEDRIWSLASQAIRKQVEREGEFFQGLRTDLIKRAYMTMTPAQRQQAVMLEESEEVEEFIRVNAGAFLVVAYQVDRNDILEHLKPASAQPMLFRGRVGGE